MLHRSIGKKLFIFEATDVKRAGTAEMLLEENKEEDLGGTEALLNGKLSPFFIRYDGRSASH